METYLPRIQPREWEYVSYTDEPYHTFEISRYEQEYLDVTKPFNDAKLIVRSLERIQHPFLLARFIVRKEQKEFRHEMADKLTYYHPIHRSDLKAALEYNMDVRRYVYQVLENQVNGKTPKFFKCPRSAANAIQDFQDKVILVCNILGSRYSEPTCTSKTNDSEYVPTYVVALV